MHVGVRCEPIRTSSAFTDGTFYETVADLFCLTFLLEGQTDDPQPYFG